MSDHPERGVATMRRQLEMILEFDDALVDEILDCETNDEISALDLSSDDIKLFRYTEPTDREELFSITEADAEVLLEMSREIRLLGEAEYSIQRHEFLLRRNMVLAKEVGGLQAALEDREAAEDIVAHINAEKNGSPETNKDYRTAFRTFGDILTEGDDPPDSIDWVPGGYPSNYDPAPQPEKMYRWEEHVVPMLEACHNSRDRALIALAWDVGPRPGELFDLTLDRFSDHKYGMKVTLYQGKQGTRSPILVPSVPYVQQWLEDHPAPEGSDAPLWSKLNRPDGVSNNRVRDIFKARAKGAEMTPPSTPTPTRFRKSSASHLASQPGVSQANLEDHHGWKRGSPVAARYIAVFADANDRAIAGAHGIDVEEDEPEAIGPVECVRCGQSTPRHRDRCIHCQQAMSHAAAQEEDHLQETGYRAVGQLVSEQGYSPDEAAEIVGVLTSTTEIDLDDVDLPSHDSSPS